MTSGKRAMTQTKKKKNQQNLNETSGKFFFFFENPEIPENQSWQNKKKIYKFGYIIRTEYIYINNTIKYDDCHIWLG